MIDYLLRSLPIVVALVIYFVRLEVKIATIQRDICWIKKAITPCQPRSANPTE